MTDDEIMSVATLHETHGDAWQDAEYRFTEADFLAAARALLTHYGQPDHFRDAAQMIGTHAADAQRWQKARALPRSWWRDAFNRIAAEGVTLDDLIDAEMRRKLP